MTQLLLERNFDPAMTKHEVLSMAQAGTWCFEQYRVDWLGSMLSADGTRMVCRFEARDAESIRQALRTLEADTRTLWEATVHEVDDPDEPNVIVERNFREPVRLDDLQAREDAHQWCLDTYNVKFVRTFFSLDRQHMLCLYCAPDAEAVKSAQLQASMPLERVWSFQPISAVDVAAGNQR